MAKIIEDTMAKGFSLKVASLEADISEETLFQWMDPDSKYFKPDISEAIKRGYRKCRKFWESKGMDLVENFPTSKEDGGMSRGSGVVWIFNMKNRFREDWNDTKEIKHKGGLVVLDDDDDEDEASEEKAETPDDIEDVEV